MSDSKEILAVGSIAFDTIFTPNGNRKNILGGSSTYFSIAASLYSKVSLIGVVGSDFNDKEWSVFKKLFKKKNIVRKECLKLPFKTLSKALKK